MPELGFRKPPRFLVHLRWVVEHPEGETDRPIRRRLQAWLGRDLEGYMNFLAKSEKAFEVKKARRLPKAEPAPLPEPEEVEERPLTAIERWELEHGEIE